MMLLNSIDDENVHSEILLNAKYMCFYKVMDFKVQSLDGIPKIFKTKYVQSTVPRIRN